MSKLWTLIKVQLLTTLGINKVLKTKDGNGRQGLILTLGLIGFVSFMLILVSTIYSLMLSLVLCKIGKMELLIAIMMSSASGCALFTTIYKTKGILFGFKDYDTIMSLPIKTKTIISSRMIILYLMNILLTIIIMVPAGVIYAVYMTPGIEYYLIFMGSIFFIPFVPIVIATIIGLTISMISLKFKHRNLFETLLTFGIMTVVIILSVNSKGTADATFENIGILFSDIIYKFYPISRLYVQAICDYNLYSLLIFIGSSILIFSVFTWVIAKKYKAINTAFTSSRSGSTYKSGGIKRSSQFEALFYKETKRFFSSTLYIINTTFGLIMLLLMVGALVILEPGKLQSIFEISEFTEHINSLLPLIVSVFIAMTCTSSCSISLEGKNLWILNSAPIKISSIFLSKAAVNLMVTVPIIFFSSTSLGLYFKPSILEWIFLYLTPITYACFISIMGVTINLKFPKMEWTNEVMVIKQSMATFLALIIGIVSVAAPFLLILIFTNISRDLIMILSTCIIGISTIGIYIYLNKERQKLFRRLSE